MTDTEHTSKTPRSATGLFALLSDLLGVKGTGAPFFRLFSMTGSLGVLVSLGALAFTTAPALAAGGHVFSSSFGETCAVVPGEPCEGKFDDPTGVAVNNATGDVYVVDKGNNRVEELSSKGVFVAEFNGSGTAGELSEPEAIAIDNSGEAVSGDPSVGDLYVTDHNAVDKFSASGTYLGQITGTCPAEGETQAGGECLPSKAAVTAFGPLKGVAVDPKGRVWVYQEIEEEVGYIDAYSDAQPNTFLSSRKSKPDTPEPGFAVNSEDDFYVAHQEQLRIAKLNSKGESIQAYEAKGNTGVAVEPSSDDVSSNNDVYIDTGNPEEGAPEIRVLTPNGTEIETFGEAQLADHGGTGIAVSYADISSGDVYVADSTAGKVDIFTPAKATAYAESFSFGGEGTGSGKLIEPLGIAVNDFKSLTEPAAGDVYVVDKGNKRVEQFNSTGTEVEAEFAPPGGFNEPDSIAVDNCKNAMGEPCSTAEDPSVGDVYVTDHLPQGDSAVDKFSSTGAYEGQLRRCPEEERANGERCEFVGQPTAGFDLSLAGVAVDPEGNVWVGTGYSFEAFNEFSTTGTYIESFERPASLGSAGPAIVDGSSALDPSTGELFVDKKSSIDRYASGEESPTGLLETFPSRGLQESQGIAVSPAGTVYATERAADDVKAFDEYPLAQVAVGAVASLRPTSVTLQGSVNPEGAKVSSCEFEYGTTTSYGQTAECEPASGSLGEGKEPVLVGAKLSGLPSGMTYHYRLVAGDHVGTNRSSDHEVKTPGPSVTEEQVTFVESTTATLNAQVDPEGGATSYHFEYDTRPYAEGEGPHGTSLPVPSVAIGSGTSAVHVSVTVQGVQPGATYYYRAVAEGEPLGAPESFYGANKSFTTNPAKGSAGGGASEPCPNEARRAEQFFGSSLPDCRAYELVSPVDTNGQDAVEASGSPQNPRAAVSGDAIAYTSRGNFGAAEGSADFPEYISRRGADGWATENITPLAYPKSFSGLGPDQTDALTSELTEGIIGTSASLSAEAPPAEELSFGIYRHRFGGGPYQFVGEEQAPLGESANLEDVVYGKAGAVTEWFAGRRVPVTVTNKPGEALNGSVGSQEGSASGGEKSDDWHAVSEDGSRVIFTSPAAWLESNINGTKPVASGSLYQRINTGEPQSPMETNAKGEEVCANSADACTIDVSASQRTEPDPKGPKPVRYWSASTDGDRIFFTSTQELTNDSYTGPEDNAANLYEYEAAEPGRPGSLKDLSVDHSGEGAAVGGVVQTSADGRYVYFAAGGVLASNANSEGAKATSEPCEIPTVHEAQGSPCNLYVSREGGAPTFIATLDANDQTDWSANNTTYTRNELQTSDGGPATNTATVSPGGSLLAFLSGARLTSYDNEAAAAGECEEDLGTGGSETGHCREVYLYDAGTGALVCASCNPSGARPVGAATLANGGAGVSGSYASQWRPRNIVADGAVFFDSSDALAGAAGGVENVFELEDGRIYPISDVTGGLPSSFLDAGANGEDVFFASPNKLLPQAQGETQAVYDARIDGGFPMAAPVCTTAEACRNASPPTPAVFGPPPSATFSGPGNFTGGGHLIDLLSSNPSPSRSPARRSLRRR